jgi:hypothetical protein
VYLLLTPPDQAFCFNCQYAWQLSQVEIDQINDYLQDRHWKEWPPDAVVMCIDGEPVTKSEVEQAREEAIEKIRSDSTKGAG